ncbi:AAA family ATPase [Sorangium sp. So ce1504]
MKPGKPVRLYLDDVRKFPTVELPYGTIPIVHASAGMKRILALSYLIAWSWSEHVQASRLIGWQPSERIVVLMEEPETHLHPRWQRHIVPALLGALSRLSPSMRPQVLLTTHSPLVLASMEPHFKPASDKLFVFELHGTDVTVRELPWTKRGDAIGWLTSPVFGLEQGRSIEAERAIKARLPAAVVPDVLRGKAQPGRPRALGAPPCARGAEAAGASSRRVGGERRCPALRARGSVGRMTAAAPWKSAVAKCSPNSVCPRPADGTSEPVA